ncbi:MAG: aspartate aminotransferase family protein [Acidimicrobiia bacterium]|nr:aminotransferase class III-fold pyridoxal phosphate-dependent enzyme [bacterium]MYB24137.1 aspartate aminotransferase family protein [Acidimicrobiia bacterium]
MPRPFLHPFSHPGRDDYITLVRGEGCTLWDDAGNSYLDAMASLWYCQAGHGRAEIIDAVTDQMRSLAAYNTFAPFTNPAAEQVAAMILERSPLPDGRVFLCCSGSEAVDTALKIARQWHRLRGDNERQTVITRTNGYHGTNFGGTAAQGIAPNREGWGDLAPHFTEVPHDDLEAAALAMAAEEARPAAVISEPLQGAGGVWPPPEGYLEGLRRLCDTHGALLLLDEVICGFGRTGAWFGAQHYGVAPDIMTFAKGVTSGYQPLAGVIMSRRVSETFETQADGFLLRTGYTYSGHPAACAAGVANLELMEAEGLPGEAARIGERLSAGLRALTDDGLLAGIRGDGAVWAAELGRDAAPVRAKILEAGVIVRPIGSALAMCPPLVISDSEIDRILDTMATALR